jgi:hypothetical protein
MPKEVPRISTDLTFVTNEPGNSLRDRFSTLLTDDTRLFDCLVGYFYLSGFHKIYPSLANVEKIRILVGLQTDRTTYDLWQQARRDGELDLSHASTKQRVSQEVLDELEKAPDKEVVETGVRKFIEWLRGGKLDKHADLHVNIQELLWHERQRNGKQRKWPAGWGAFWSKRPKPKFIPHF